MQALVSNGAGLRGSALSVLVFGTPPGAGKGGRPLRALLGFVKTYVSAGEVGQLVSVALADDCFMLAGQDGTMATAEGTWTLSIGGPHEYDSVSTTVLVVQ